MIQLELSRVDRGHKTDLVSCSSGELVDFKYGEWGVDSWHRAEVIHHNMHYLLEK